MQLNQAFIWGPQTNGFFCFFFEAETAEGMSDDHEWTKNTRGNLEME